MSDDPINENLVDLRAPWRLAVIEFLKADFEPAEPIKHKWFCDQLGLEQPDPATPFAEVQRFQFAYLGYMSKLRDALLAEHQIDLQSVRGIGYEIVPSVEQTKRAEEDCTAQLKKAFVQTRDRLTNVDAAKISADQRLENANALARLSMLVGLHKQVSKGDLNPLAGLPKSESGNE